MSGEMREAVAWVVLAQPKRGTPWPFLDTIRSTRRASIAAFDEGAGVPGLFERDSASKRVKVAKCIIAFDGMRWSQ